MRYNLRAIPVFLGKAMSNYIKVQLYGKSSTFF